MGRDFESCANYLVCYRKKKISTHGLKNTELIPPEARVRIQYLITMGRRLIACGDIGIG